MLPPQASVNGGSVMSGGDRRNHIEGGTNTEMQKPIPGPQHDISCPSVPSQLVSKMPKFSIMETLPKKGKVLFEQWAFKIKSVMQSHMEVTLRKGIV